MLPASGLVCVREQTDAQLRICLERVWPKAAVSFDGTEIAEAAGLGTAGKPVSMKTVRNEKEFVALQRLWYNKNIKISLAQVLQARVTILPSSLP